jgi:hypothetical protein
MTQRLAALLLVAACAASRPPPPATGVSDPMPARRAPPPVVERKPKEPAKLTAPPPPASGSPLPFAAIEPEYTAFADEVCACADLDCLTKVVNAHPDFVERLSRLDATNMTLADHQALQGLATRIGGCISKLTSAGP